MKLQKALIRNFKGVREVAIDFRRDDGSPRPVTALVGENGSGKTTVLQAIALTLSLATKRTDMGPLRWPGFHTDRVGSLGPTHVELTVAFEPAELRAVRGVYDLAHPALPGAPPPTPLAERIRALVDPGSFAPEGHSVVTLKFGGTDVTAEPASGLSQFRGRYWLGKAETSQPAAQTRRRDVGDVFWFTQLRSLAEHGDAAAQPRTGIQSRAGDILFAWDQGVGRLRNSLNNWWSYHKSEVRNGTPDLIQELEQRLDRLFPGIRFLGPTPQSATAGADPMGWYFFVERDGRRYDLAEMSSGEQAVFPLLLAFVQLGIARSIVLIDELELHLHPPEQQALLSALRTIGPDCQFIITTHSPYLTRALAEDEVVRLDQGRVCP